MVPMVPAEHAHFLVPCPALSCPVLPSEREGRAVVRPSDGVQVTRYVAFGAL